MSSKFESSVRNIPYAQTSVYAMLSDLSNVERIKDKVPADKLQGLKFTKDSLALSSPVGDIELKVVDREEPKTIKFETVKSPVALLFWIQLLPTADNACKMKLTIQAELNPFIKGMVQKPLQEGLEKAADVLQALKYE